MHNTSRKNIANPNSRSILLIVLLCVLTLGSVAYLLLQDISQQQCVAFIYQDNILLYTIDLRSVSEPYSLTISGENGSYNTLEISYESIAVIEASCHNQTCVHMGSISNGALPILCIPNRLRIEIHDKDTTTDAFSY